MSLPGRFDLGGQNPYLSLDETDLTYQDINAFLDAAQCNAVRFGAGGHVGDGWAFPSETSAWTSLGGALVWRHYGNTPGGDECVRTREAARRLRETNVQHVSVNIDPFREADLLNYAADGTNPYIAGSGIRRLPWDMNGIAGYVAWVTDMLANHLAVHPETTFLTTFQVWNEPHTDAFWEQEDILAPPWISPDRPILTAKAAYAWLVYKTGKAVHAAIPGSTVILAGMIPSWIKPVLKVLDAICEVTGEDRRSLYDMVDLHLFGHPDQVEVMSGRVPYDTMTDKIAEAREAQGIPTKPFAYLENACYSGTPQYCTWPEGVETWTEYPTKTQEQHARDVLKRLAYPPANEIGWTLWAYLSDTRPQYAPGTPPPAGKPYDQFFFYTGLWVRDPSAPKLAYWSVQKLGQWFARVDWRQLALLDIGVPYVKVITAPNENGHTSFLAWWDFYHETDPPATRTVQIPVGGIVGAMDLAPCLPIDPATGLYRSSGGTVVEATDFPTTRVSVPGGLVSVVLDHNPWTGMPAQWGTGNIFHTSTGMGDMWDRGGR